MKKHAYLILAHKNWKQLSILMSLLDDLRNDIFIHVDAKSRLSMEQKNEIKVTARNSEVYFVESISVTRGGYSLVQAELLLLKKATETSEYSYYHLLSGQDLPIKTQRYIHEYFDMHRGTEYIMFGSEEWIKSVEARVKYYWLFQDFVSDSKTFIKRILRVLDRIGVYLQSVIGVNRLKGIKFSAGSQWFSITDMLARYIVDNEEFVKKLFKNTNCGDESLVQVMSINSSILEKNRHFNISDEASCNLRKIEWNNGYPYVYTTMDFEKLMDSDFLFARKFDYNIDNKIINDIFTKLKSN